VAVIFGVRFLPQNPIGQAETYYLVGGILAFALLYYLVIYRYFSKNNRLYLKSISDIILIGVLIHLMKDYGQFFFALYFIPIAAAALSLELISALLIGTVASLLVAAEIYFNAQDILPIETPAYQGIWQIGFIVFVTIFCRMLAVELRHEQAQKEQSLAREKLLKEEAAREKEFLSLTSHQLYTPTSIIRGFSSLLREEDWGKLSPKQRDAVEEIYVSSKRMADLVSELLSISRIQANQLEIKKSETDLAAMSQNIIDQIEHIKPDKSITIKLKLPTEIKPINADSEKIRMVIYNLLDNALKYTSHGEVVLSLSQTDKETKFEVKDNGIGISPEDFEKLFQPFFRGKSILELDNKGTGLGLYIARLIVERHGGKIWAESEGLNKGSKFIFTILNN
jgi:signal transduction histidine kinase